MSDDRTTRLDDVDTGEVYERVRQSFLAVVADLTAEQWATMVPATPAWSIHDAVSHVVGIAAGLNALEFPESDDVGGERWARHQVEARRGHTFAELRSEWDREAPTFEAGLRDFGYEFGSHFVADLHAHYHDVRRALRLAPDRDPAAVRVALDHYLLFVHESLIERDWGSIEIVADGVIRAVGVGPTRARVTADEFDLLRSCSARRTRREVAALDWSGDVAAVLAVLDTIYTGGYRFPDDGERHV